MICLCGSAMLLMYTGRVWCIWRCHEGTHLLMAPQGAGPQLWYHLVDGP
ncbi:hypothetical protein LCGC14_2132790 [marine sediment metagenome]|uniref:Uncharacterized protein n=1 Tax=marine sediment metagenome TaxID=412755 RepID=A0A0F9GDV2_9ZZZZ